MPRIYAYVITHDYGFAPNPYEGICTLATCKPQIRKKAMPGDWLVGSASTTSGLGNSIVYAAKIDRVCTMEEYGCLPEFERKRPSIAGTPHRRHGDNIYYFDDGNWQMRRNPHHSQLHREHDLSGQNVLIAETFWYFGTNPQPLPTELLPIIKKGPGHKCTSDPQAFELLELWLGAFPQGMTGSPAERKFQGAPA